MDDDKVAGSGPLSEGFEAIGKLAREGIENASEGMRQVIGGLEIGDERGPEKDFSRSMPIREALATVSRQGLDPVAGDGFEQHTHQIAQDAFGRERDTRERQRNLQSGRDL
ncbi:hypothetical protein GCM10019059_36060 [Camelimonas fluminis]|uniref:Uncharacterized protein n=1 Tax=Camelimonas fluminis TaxID=1576911 RepID=A0ABV7UIP1_9HYPH|nr:hypothetical protein [Camelimonas fluminis]GHE73262.1 hypothetical protein GCM10019059_36060 [Camelimonas fluminis]